MASSATPDAETEYKTDSFFVCKMSTFLRSNSRNSFGFSLFSVDSGDQKIKTFYTFFGFSAQIGATYIITWN
jgi:hypothetical protein